MLSNSLDLGLETEISVLLPDLWVDFCHNPSSQQQKKTKLKTTFCKAGSGNVVFTSLWLSGEMFAGCKVLRDLSTQL